MPSINISGSQNATLDTEHELAEIAAAGTYQLVVDVANMAAGDILVLRIYGKARSSDSERLIHSATLADAQNKTLSQSPIIVSPHHYRVTLEQAGGTGRAYPFAVYAL